MPIKATCKSCQRSYKVKEEMAGKKFNCKECGEVVRIPAPTATASAPRSASFAKRSEPARRSRQAVEEDFGDLAPAPRGRRSQPRSKPKPAEDDFGFDAAPLPPKRRRTKPPKRNLDRTPQRVRHTQPLSEWMLKGKQYSDRYEETEDWKLLLWAIAGVLMGLAFPVVSWYCGSHIYYAASSTSWPTTEATVLGTDITERLGGRRWNKSWRYTPHVLYAYQVDGEQYENDEISFSSYESRDPLDAEAVIAKYAVGTKHTLHYNSSNPAKSILEPGATNGTWLYLIFPFLCMLGPSLAYTHGLAFYYRINADLRAQFG